jgi:uncharacterized protein (DUF2336 family)
LGKFARISLLPLNLVSDLEKAIAGRSADANAMLNQITDLFLLNVGHYTVEQLDVYDDVLKKLIAKVEVAARAMLARRLALVNKAPPNTIRSLALDDAIEVAEPILSQYNALDDDILTRCIAIKGQEHLLAIATRNKISETISYHLIAKGSTKVLGTLATNPGAAISDTSFGILVKKSAGDEWLSECVAGRKDIPEHHLRELVSKASKIVRQRLLTSNPDLSDIIQEIFPLNTSTANKTPSPATDYSTAERLVKSLELTETVVIEFAREKKLAEMVASIAQLSRLSAYEIERLFMGPWTSPVAVILKALGFRLSTVDAIYHSRLAAGQVIRNDLIQTKAEFIAIRRPTAERILRFFYAKRAVTISNLSGDSSPGRRRTN